MLGSRDDNKLSLGAAWLSFASLFQCEVSRVGRHLYLFSVFNRVKPPLPIITQTTKPSSCLLLLAPTPPFLFSSLQHLLPQRNLWEEKAFWVFQKPTSPCLTSVPRCSECCSETNAFVCWIPIDTFLSFLFSENSAKAWNISKREGAFPLIVIEEGKRFFASSFRDRRDPLEKSKFRGTEFRWKTGLFSFFFFNKRKRRPRRAKGQKQNVKSIEREDRLEAFSLPSFNSKSQSQRERERERESKD